MKKLASITAPVVGLIGLLLAMTVWAGPYDKYVTVADAQKVTGIAGIKLVPRNIQKGAGGNLNFARADGQLALMVQFERVSFFKQYKDGFFNGKVAGVGQEAFHGPARGIQNILVFCKGGRCVTLSTYFPPKNPTKPVLSMAQLIALGKIIAARMT